MPEIEVGAGSALYPPTKKDAMAMLLVRSGVWDGDKGPPEFQVKKLVDAMFAPGVTSEQRKQASQALNEVLDLKAPKAITPQDTKPDVWNKKILAGIDAQYGNGPDKLDLFWDAVQKKKPELAQDNPLRLYQSQSLKIEAMLTKARAKDRAEFELQVKKLADAMSAEGVTPDQRRQASQALNGVLKLQGEQALTEQDISSPQQWQKKLAAGITTRYANSPDPLRVFLSDIKKIEGLTDGNPLKNYKSDYPGSYAYGLKIVYDYLKVFNNIDPDKKDYKVVELDDQGVAKNRKPVLDAQGNQVYEAKKDRAGNPVKGPDGNVIMVPKMQIFPNIVSGQFIRDNMAMFVADSAAQITHSYRLRHPGDSLIPLSNALELNGVLNKELYGLENHTRSYPFYLPEIMDSGEVKGSSLVDPKDKDKTAKAQAANEKAFVKRRYIGTVATSFELLQNSPGGKPVSLAFPLGSQPDDMAFADLSADNIIMMSPENSGRDALAAARDAARGAVTFTPQQSSPVLADAPTKPDISFPPSVTGGKDPESDNVRNSAYAAGPAPLRSRRQ